MVGSMWRNYHDFLLKTCHPVISFRLRNHSKGSEQSVLGGWQRQISPRGLRRNFSGETRMKHQPGTWLRSGFFLVASCGGLLIAGTFSAEARITNLTNCATISPYGAESFGMVGTYEQLACTAKGAVDPNDPLNAIIQDLNLAPKDAHGLVEYSMDVTILMPTDLTKSNHVMLFDVPNRGNRLLPGGFNIGGSTTSAGDGFLHSQGSSWWPVVGRATCYPVAAD